MCVTVIASPKIYFQNFVSCDLMVNYQTLQQPVTYQNADFKVKLQWQELQWLLRAKHLLLTMYQNRIEKKNFKYNKSTCILLITMKASLFCMWEGYYVLPQVVFEVRLYRRVQLMCKFFAQLVFLFSSDSSLNQCIFFLALPYNLF